MFMPDPKTIAICGGAAAALLASVYILWGPSDKKRKPKNKATCPGLINFGNTCFLNAVLQALAPCSSVVHWLTNFVPRRQESNHLASTVSRVLKVLNNESVESEAEEYSPVEVLDALRARRWVISPDEQDAHELFHVLTETLDEESTKYPSVISLFDVDQLEDPNSQNGGLNHHTAQCRIRSLMPRLPSKGSEHPFRGLLASQLKCKSCGHKYPVKYDLFDSLSLSLTTGQLGGTTLEQLLKHFVINEAIENVECEGCAKILNSQEDAQNNNTAKPPPKTTFSKKLTIGKLPQCLCIHVQRTTWLNNGMPMKRYDHVQFPEILSMEAFVYQKKTNPSIISSLADMDMGPGLVGGRKHLNGYNQVNTRKLHLSSPAVTLPYSQPVNVLKALNYHSRATANGIYVQQQPNGGSDNVYVQQLAHMYSTEAVSVAQRPSNAYKLTSVVEHVGDVFSGHFVTYRRAPSTIGQRFPNRWLYTSDSLVKKASIKEVLNASAYMLFYERI